MDQENWKRALDVSTAEYARLSSGRREELKRLLTVIMDLKRSLVQLVTSAGSSEVCRTCGGECCLLGKYHVSVLDILAFHHTGAAPVLPDFGRHPACPYSSASGCQMAPEFRPLTCVYFNCQPVEELLGERGLAVFADCESRLRRAVADAGRLWGARIDRPLLLSADGHTAPVCR